jgi:hypothetical protein
MFLGVFLHLSYLASRSLVVPMMLHVLNNSISISAPHICALGFLNTPATEIPWYCYAAAALSLATVAWAFFVTRCRLIPDVETNQFAWRPAFPGVESPPLWSATRVLCRWPWPAPSPVNSLNRPAKPVLAALLVLNRFQIHGHTNHKQTNADGEQPVFQRNSEAPATHAASNEAGLTDEPEVGRLSRRLDNLSSDRGDLRRVEAATLSSVV